MNRSVVLIPVLALLAGLLAFRPMNPAFGPAPAPAEHIKWLSIQEAYALNQKAPRKIIVDVYTDWCGWCKVMDRETFSRPAIVDFVNKNYYAVKLNAEQKEDITLGGQTYKSVGNMHGLAVNLLQSKMSFPTTVFMNEKFELIQPVAGYLEPRIFHQIVTYFGGDYFKQESFDTFKVGTYTAKYQVDMPAGK
jgi:thioredoxin-related protein